METAIFLLLQWENVIRVTGSKKKTQWEWNVTPLNISCVITLLSVIEQLLAFGQSSLQFFCNAATIYGHANKQMTSHCTVLHYCTIPAFTALPSPRPALPCSAVQ